MLHRINKDEGDESVALPAFQRHVVNAIFLKYSKECILTSSHERMRNILLAQNRRNIESLREQ